MHNQSQYKAKNRSQFGNQTQIVDQVHQRAQLAVEKFKACEVELLEALEQCERHRVFLALGFNSLFTYATGSLGLSEDVAFIYINVARKARDFPALKAAIADGSITVSKAVRLTKIMNKENEKHWLEMAKTSSKRELEKLIATENPREAVAERINFVSADRMEMELGISEKLMIRLRRAQDVISQKRRRPVSLEETIDVICSEYLRREDPVEKAERQLAKGKLRDNFSQLAEQQQLGPGQVQSNRKSTDKFKLRRPLPSFIRHRITLKFKGQCAYQNENGQRCQQRRFLDVHHIKPLSEGGADNLENLELLCSGHHRLRHGASGGGAK